MLLDIEVVDRTALMRQLLIKTFIKLEIGQHKLMLDKDLLLVGIDPDEIRKHIAKQIQIVKVTPLGYEPHPYLILEKSHNGAHERYCIDETHYRFRLESVPDTNFTRWIVAGRHYVWLACLRGEYWRTVTPEEVELLKRLKEPEKSE